MHKTSPSKQIRLETLGNWRFAGLLGAAVNSFIVYRPEKPLEKALPQTLGILMQL